MANDEYFAITNEGGYYISLRNWSVTDGEGVLTFISDTWIIPGKSLTMSMNSTSFWCAFERLPDVSLDSPDIGLSVHFSGTFRLADSGDSLALRSPQGELIDFVAYGAINESSSGWSGLPMPSLKRGEVAKRILLADHLIDTDSAEDWKPFREFRYGYTEFGRQRFELPSGGIVAFTSPDCSLNVVLDLLDNASHSVCICSYEFSSARVCYALIEAINRGVMTRLLVDGAPAGDMSRDEIACLSVLSMAGAEVLIINGNMSKGIVQHIGALHAKYIVVDGYYSIVTSENFVEQGMPSDRLFGNRGWGICISSSDLAACLQKLFDSDARLSRKDLVEWKADSRFDSNASIPLVNRSVHVRGLISPYQSSEGSIVTVIVSPDGSATGPFLSDFIRVSHTLLIEQFQTDLYWESRWDATRILNPLVLGLLDVANRGGEVRALFDSSWFNLARNGQVLECVRENASGLGRASIELLDQRSPITALHNKGAVIDGKYTLVSSNNWVSASFSRNRELAILIDSREVASFFGQAFDLDWYPDETPPVAAAGSDVEIHLGENITLSANGSSDDRAIASVAWDVGADGVIDSYGECIRFNATYPGKETIVLKVTDAWGNTAVAQVFVTVLPSPFDEDERARFSLRSYWFLPLCIGAAIVFLRFVRKGSADRGSRNLNHRPRG